MALRAVSIEMAILAQDVGKRVNEELLEIHAFFKTADEAYRELRKLLMEDSVIGSPEENPIAWLPSSLN